MLSLIPRGEFSVVIAALAVGAGVDARLGPLTAAYVLLTILLAAAVQKLPNRLAATRARRREAEPDPSAEAGL